MTDVPYQDTLSMYSCSVTASAKAQVLGVLGQRLLVALWTPGAESLRGASRDRHSAAVIGYGRPARRDHRVCDLPRLGWPWVRFRIARPDRHPPSSPRHPHFAARNRPSCHRLCPLVSDPVGYVAGLQPLPTGAETEVLVSGFFTLLAEASPGERSPLSYLFEYK